MRRSCPAICRRLDPGDAVDGRMHSGSFFCELSASPILRFGNRTRCLGSMNSALTGRQGFDRSPWRGMLACQPASSCAIGRRRQAVRRRFCRFCRTNVLGRCPLISDAKSVCVKRFSARRYVEFVQSATPADGPNGIELEKKVKIDATRSCRKEMGRGMKRRFHVPENVRFD